MWWKILIPIAVVILLVWKLYGYRRNVIGKKIQKLKLDPKEERELWILACKCWDRAVEEGIKLPTHDAIVCRLNDDPYTWIILKLGIHDREIFRTRMSLEDVSNARLEAAKENKEEET